MSFVSFVVHNLFTMHEPESSARDHLLADLLAHLTEEYRLGREPDVAAAAQGHPEVAEELRGLWAVSQLARDMIRSDAAVASPPARAEGVVAAAPLPRPFGKYELLEELGRGGMGVVYKAQQQNPDRFVAIKMILRGELASSVDIQRFQAEAQSAARLDGIPGVVAIHEVDQVDGQPYFSMEFIEGATLAQRLKLGDLPLPAAIRCLASVSEAVHRAHQQGILHRDLKPSNILIDVHGDPHVMDFGLAKRVASADAITRTGAIVGTPSYMPPEQAAGSRGHLSPASDVYSLGAILYEILTGQPPFQASSPVDTLLMVLDRDVVPPRVLNRQVDPVLAMICLKCLQKPADLRYQSASELAADLRGYLTGGEILARQGGIVSLVGHLLRDTHHASVLENWGLLWMTHSFMILALVLVTIALYQAGFESHWLYLVLWIIVLMAWGQIFWWLRRQGGPITFVERLLAHAYAAGIMGSISMFLAEVVLGLPVLTMAPGLAMIAGMIFLVKAGMLSGRLYFWAAAFFATSGVMALLAGHREMQLLLFGLMSWASFFFPGLKYYRLRNRQVVSG